MFADRETSTLVARTGGYAVSHDKEKVLVRARGAYQLHNASGQGEPHTISPAGLMVDCLPAEEWAQIFDEGLALPHGIASISSGITGERENT